MATKKLYITTEYPLKKLNVPEIAGEIGTSNIITNEDGVQYILTEDGTPFINEN